MIIPDLSVTDPPPAEPRHLPGFVARSMAYPPLSTMTMTSCGVTCASIFPQDLLDDARPRTIARVSMSSSVIGPNVKMMQSMLFIKSEGKPARLAPDEAHIRLATGPTAVWIPR